MITIIMIIDVFDDNNIIIMITMPASSTALTILAHVILLYTNTVNTFLGHLVHHRILSKTLDKAYTYIVDHASFSVLSRALTNPCIHVTTTVQDLLPVHSGLRFFWTIPLQHLKNLTVHKNLDTFISFSHSLH